MMTVSCQDVCVCVRRSYHLNPTDVTIGFEADNYSVVEGSTVDACLILNGSTEVNVVVNLLVGEGGTASMC